MSDEALLTQLQDCLLLSVSLYSTPLFPQSGLVRQELKTEADEEQETQPALLDGGMHVAAAVEPPVEPPVGPLSPQQAETTTVSGMTPNEKEPGDAASMPETVAFVLNKEPHH